MNNWKKTVDHLTAEFMRWGCPFSRKQLPEDSGNEILNS